MSDSSLHTGREPVRVSASAPAADQAVIHDREAHFHDQWALSTKVEEVEVRAAFEALTAPENRYILSRMGDLRGKTILDVGAGLGESSVYFALQGAKVTTTDVSPEMVAFAERLARHHGTHVTGAVSTGEDLNVPEGSFDFVYIANTIHHVTDRDAMYRGVKRALKPGGQFFSWDPLAYNPVINVYRSMATDVRTPDEQPLTFAELDRVRQHFVDVGHREFWIASLLLFMKYYAFDRVHPNADRYWKRIYKETPRSLWWWRPLAAADSVLGRTPLVRRLAWNMVMHGRKA